MNPFARAWRYFKALLQGKLDQWEDPEIILNEAVREMKAHGTVSMRTIGSLLLMCDPRDLGVAVTEDTVPTPHGFEPNVFLYDAYPGGIGQSQPLFTMRDRLMAASGSLLRECPCETGCPSCVGPLGEVGERGKEVALRLLDLLTSPGTAQSSPVKPALASADLLP